jgi:hypothetical protein
LFILFSFDILNSSTTPEPFAQQALNALHVHRIRLHVPTHLAFGALALPTLQMAAALLAPAQLSVAGDPETFGRCFVRFHLWHKKTLLCRFPQSHQLGLYPCLCLCLGFSQITYIVPLRLTILHFGQRRLTDGVTFNYVTP